jgi:mannosyltransferase
VNKADRRFVIAVMLLAALLRIYRLGHQSLWVDEILTYIVSNPKADLNIWDYLKYNLHGPLHSFFVYLFNLVNDGDAWLRLPSAIAGTASVYLLYRWVYHWLGVRVARVASLLLAIHPLHIHYSQEVRNYSFLLFFGLLANFLFHRLLAEERKSTYVYYVIAMAMAALSNFTAAFLFVTHTLILLIRKGIKPRVLLRWIAVAFAVLILISPWVYRIYVVIDFSKLVTPVMPGELTVNERLRGETTVTFAAVPYIAYAFSTGFTLGPSLRELHYHHSLLRIIGDNAWIIGWIGALFGFIFITGVAALKDRKQRLLELALYLLIPILLTFLLSWQNAKAFNIRYVLLSLPAFLCLLACGLLAISKRRVALVVWTALVVTMCASLVNYYYNDRYAKENVRDAAHYIAGLEEQPRCILVPTIRDVFDHYYSGEAELFGVFAPRGVKKTRVEKRLNQLFARCNSFWYIRAREWVDDADGYILDILTQRCVILESVDLTGVRMMHFRLKSEATR